MIVLLESVSTPWKTSCECLFQQSGNPNYLVIPKKLCGGHWMSRLETRWQKNERPISLNPIRRWDKFSDAKREHEKLNATILVGFWSNIPVTHLIISTFCLGLLIHARDMFFPGRFLAMKELQQRHPTAINLLFVFEHLKTATFLFEFQENNNKNIKKTPCKMPVHPGKFMFWTPKKGGLEADFAFQFGWFLDSIPANPEFVQEILGTSKSELIRSTPGVLGALVGKNHGLGC